MGVMDLWRWPILWRFRKMEPGEAVLSAAETDFFAALDALAEAWRNRRCDKALKAYLKGYPLGPGMTDDWGRLFLALKEVKAVAGGELTPEEKKTVAGLNYATGQ